MWMFETIQSPQFVIHDTYGCSDAGPIIVAVVGSFRDSCKYHCAIRQRRRVGEAKRDPIDLSQIKPIDGCWRDRGGLIGTQRIEECRKLKPYYSVFGMPFIS